MKKVVWEGDSKEVIQTFPKGVKEDLGAALWTLQIGEIPPCSRPMTSISSGVFELKAKDASGQYRSIYTTKIGNNIFVLHCFVKKSQKTTMHDLGIATQRLKAVLERNKP
jgi:phage-related protein